MKKSTRRSYLLLPVLFSALILTSLFLFYKDSGSRNQHAQTSNSSVNAYVPTPCPFYNDALPIDNEEYDVYSAILSQTSINAKNMVVTDHTISGLVENVKQIKPFTSALLSEETISDYLSKVQRNQKLSNHFSVCGKVSLVNEKELKQFQQLPESWEEFRRKYPEAWGIVIFSRVGFDPARMQALVGVKTVCGKDCGEGTYWFVQKENGKWRAERNILIRFSW